MSAIAVTPAWMDPAKIRFVTVHTTASALGKRLTAAQVSSIDQRIWGQTSYHYVIELDGTVTQTLRHNQRGAHTGNHNTGNLGISYVGGLGADGKPADTRTPAQRAAMERLLRELRRQYPAAKILGHRDWSPDTNGNGKVDKWEWVKACPCFDVADLVRELSLAPVSA